MRLRPRKAVLGLALALFGLSFCGVGCSARISPHLPPSWSSDASSPSPAPSEEPSAPSEGAGTPSGESKEPLHSDAERPKWVFVPPEERESVLVLVNATRRLPAEYRPPDLVRPAVRAWIPEGDERGLLRREAARALEELFRAAEERGFRPVLVSGYRSYALQAQLYARQTGGRDEEPEVFVVAPPGASEHQTGLAVDLGQEDGKYLLQPEFAHTALARWLSENAPRFGFVLRYPAGKEAITRVVFEPWHYRYVGREAAEEMARTNVVLEEYLAARGEGN